MNPVNYPILSFSQSKNPIEPFFENNLISLQITLLSSNLISLQIIVLPVITVETIEIIEKKPLKIENKLVLLTSPQCLDIKLSKKYYYNEKQIYNENNRNDEKIKLVIPSIKWAGGKYQLREIISLQINPLNFTKYIEVFCGGLAILFHLINIGKINKKTIVILNDINKVLILFYICIKDNINLLINEIKLLCNSEKDYYIHREDFNKLIINEYSIHDYTINKEIYSTIEKYKNKYIIKMSALFLYLNKSCFNGLFRLNKNGLFNTSSNKKKYIISKKEINNIINMSEIFNTFDITFKAEHYKNIIKSNDHKDTLMYIDPVYHPVNKSSFVNYTNIKFDFDDFFKCVNSIKHSYIVYSNSFCDQVLNTSKNFIIKKIDANRKINSKGSKRKCKELLMTNFILFDTE